LKTPKINSFFHLTSKFSSFVNRGNFAKKLDSVILYSDAKNPIKADDWNHHTEDKREGQKRTERGTTIKNQRRERASPSGVGSYLTQSPSCTQVQSKCFEQNLLRL
jgi:hypothetical protein